MNTYPIRIQLFFLKNVLINIHKKKDRVNGSIVIDLVYYHIGTTHFCLILLVSIFEGV